MTFIGNRYAPHVLGIFVMSLLLGVHQLFGMSEEYSAHSFTLSAYIGVMTFLTLMLVIISSVKAHWLSFCLAGFICFSALFYAGFAPLYPHTLSMPLHLLMQHFLPVLAWLHLLSFIYFVAQLVVSELKNPLLYERVKLMLMMLSAVALCSVLFPSLGVGFMWQLELPIFLSYTFAGFTACAVIAFKHHQRLFSVQCILFLYFVGAIAWLIAADRVQLVQLLFIDSVLVATAACIALFQFEHRQMLAMMTTSVAAGEFEGQTDINQLTEALDKLSEITRPFALIVFEINYSSMLRQVLSEKDCHQASVELLRTLREYFDRSQHLFRFAITDFANQGLNRTTICRAGHDTFACVVVGELKNEELRYLIPAMQEIVNRPMKYNHHVVKANCVVAIVEYPEIKESGRRLVSLAKRTLSKAEASPSQCATYTPGEMNAKSASWQLVIDLQQAIENEAIEIYHQPQIDLSSQSVFGSEALLRWHHPEFGFVNPELVVKLAEEHNLIHSLTELVVRRSLEQLAKIWDSGFKQRISINISALDLLQANFIPHLVSCASHSHVTLDYVTIELTESAAMGDVANALAVFHDMNQLKLRVAIDDFGTGYSSLATLATLPFHELKIDKRFIKSVSSSPKDLSITKATLKMAQQLDVAVVAEGVEDNSSQQLLKELGCDYSQGYYYAKPLDIEEYITWLNNQQIENSNNFCQANIKTIAK